MDNNAYEQNMINFVNRNYKNAEQARQEAYHTARLYKKGEAAFRIVLWLGAFFIAVLVAFYLNQMDIVPGEIPETISAVVGFVTGSRVNALRKAFKKR